MDAAIADAIVGLGLSICSQISNPTKWTGEDTKSDSSLVADMFKIPSH